MDPIRVGIIGIGKMGMLHGGILRALDGVEVRAIADKDKIVPNLIAGIMPDIKFFSDYHRMLDEENLDLVYITTPAAIHPVIIEDCVERGLSFFVEKPLGTSVPASAAAVNRLQQKPVVNMVGYCKHYVDTFRKGKAIIESKVLGELLYLQSYMYVSQNFGSGKGWRYKKESSGGGVLNILATHLVDVLLWYFGDVASVGASTKAYYSQDVEDFVHSYLVFKSGLEGYLDASWSVRDYRLPEIKIEVNARNGKLIVTEDYVKLYLDKTSRWETHYKQDLYQGVDIDVGGPEYTREDKEMVQAVRNGRSPELDVSYALRVQQISDAIYDSARLRAPVELKELVVRV